MAALAEAAPEEAEEEGCLEFIIAEVGMLGSIVCILPKNLPPPLPNGKLSFGGIKIF